MYIKHKSLITRIVFVRYKNLFTCTHGTANLIGSCSLPILLLHSSIIDKYFINKSNWYRISVKGLFFHSVFISTLYKNICKNDNTQYEIIL